MEQLSSWTLCLENDPKVLKKKMDKSYVGIKDPRQQIGILIFKHI